MSGRAFLRLSVVALLAAGVLAACGDGGDGNGDGTTAPATVVTSAAVEDSPGATTDGGDGGSSELADGCTIVTAADAQAVFGEPMKKSADVGTEPPQVLTRCIWEGGTTGLVSHLLQFRVWDGTMFYAPDQFKSMDGFEEIDGLGDGAYAYGTGSYDLTIRSGDYTITLSASGFDAADRARVRQEMLDLGAKVIDEV